MTTDLGNFFGCPIFDQNLLHCLESLHLRRKMGHMLSLALHRLHLLHQEVMGIVDLQHTGSPSLNFYYLLTYDVYLLLFY